MKEKLLSKGKKYDNMGMIEVGGGNMKKSKGFTLIELLAVIVILAIIALIATPIILNIINDSREKSNLRSIEGYGKSVEETISRLMMDSDYTGSNIRCEMTGDITNCYDLNNSDVSMEVTYSGNRIKDGTIAVDGLSGNVIISGVRVGSSSDYYSYTTEAGAKVYKVTPLECFNFEDGNIWAANNYKTNNKCTSDLVIPSSYKDENGDEVYITRIDAGSFQDLELTSLIIPPTVTEIGDSAFKNNSLSNIILPNNVNHIEGWAFYQNPLELIVMGNADYLENNIFYDDTDKHTNDITIINKTGNDLDFGIIFIDEHLDDCIMKSGIIEAERFSELSDHYHNPKITIIEG